MKYQPSSSQTVEQWISGLSSKPCEISNNSSSRSLFAYDRKVLIQHCRNVLTDLSIHDMWLEYPSESYINFEEGKYYLFAVNQENCLGFVELANMENVLLPDGTITALVEYARTNLHHPFPDYFGTFGNA